MHEDLRADFRALIDAAQQVSEEVGEAIQGILEEGLTNPLPPDEARDVLSRVVEVMKAQALARGDAMTAALLDREAETVLNRALELRARVGRQRTIGRASTTRRVALQEHNGVAPRAVLPSPVFHGRDVPMVQGFVRTRDINLWDENERIDIHLNQFQRAHDRRPAPSEVLELMLGQMRLPGLDEDDQFEIRELARSIAVNGVRKPPIIDVDGTLLDGNRRITACYHILSSPDFTADEKRRAEWVQVWQLTDHATAVDRDAVIVSLNFEPDHKQDWPEYVKARKVHEEWQAMLALEPRANSRRQAELKRQLSKKFALGPDTSQVNRYIQMVELADEFEDYHVADRQRDKYEAKHRAERYFQYFDELGKGSKPGGVHWHLNQDEEFKHLVYDLLYHGKFKNWNKIRDLKYVANHEEARAYLREARDERDLERAQELVDDGCAVARSIRSVERVVGGNKRVEVFCDWLEDAPVRVFQSGSPDSIRSENLVRLHRALKLIEPYTEAAREAANGD